MNDLTMPSTDTSVPIDSWTSLPSSLHRARDAVVRQFRSVLRQRGLSEQQSRVLTALAQRDHVAVLRLARATDLLGPSLSRILHDLEERVLITRVSTHDDLRSALISISPDGRALIESISMETERIHENIVARIGFDRLISLRDLLQHVERRLP
jgi:homoprotocatechuate degradation regulator HpaR